MGSRDQNDSWQEEGKFFSFNWKGRGKVGCVQEEWLDTLELPSSGVFFADKLEAGSFDENEGGNALEE